MVVDTAQLVVTLMMLRIDLVLMRRMYASTFSVFIDMIVHSAQLHSQQAKAGYDHD
ncbi:MAG: hypothetical protein ACJAXW_003446 [Candidatus Azotimanducaceae bacterium]